MKTSWPILGCVLIACGGASEAEDLAVETNAPPAAGVGWTVESTIPMAPPDDTREAWMEGQHGVIGQFLEATNPLEPLNPLAPPAPRFTEATLSRDTVTGRVMGLTLVNFEF